MKSLLRLAFAATFAIACTKKPIDTSKKILNFPLRAEIEGFDPTQGTDLYTHEVVSQPYEGLLGYDYLKRPYELQPLLAESMPVISDGGKTYTFKIRKGVYFHDDPAFDGKKRELTAADVVYTLKRLADPNTKSPNYWIVEGKIVGLDEFRKSLEGVQGPVDYATREVKGLSAPDDHTFVMHLTEASPLILYSLAMTSTYILAKEVVEKYKEDLVNHPVGTGPFILKEWRRNQRLIFVKNPNYWGSTYPTEGGPGDAEKGLLAAAGAKLPFVDELHFNILVEDQPRWLNFMKGKVDIAEIPKDAYGNVFDDAGNIRDEMKTRGTLVDKQPGVDIVFQVLNMTDPIIGKNPDLRKALSMSQNRIEKIKIFYNNRAIEAQGPIPPGIFGYDEALKNPSGYDLEKAREYALKAKAVHKKLFGDKMPLKIIYETSNNPASRQIGESFVTDFKNIGLEAELQTYTWPTLTDRMKKSQGQIYGYAWNADYPDPENFLQLLYGKNVSPGPNNANFNDPEYNRLFEQMKNMPNGPARKKIIDRMVQIVHEQTPWLLFNHRISVWVGQPWVKNFKRHIISPGYFKYLDVDMKQKAETLSTWK